MKEAFVIINGLLNYRKIVCATCGFISRSTKNLLKSEFMELLRSMFERGEIHCKTDSSPLYNSNTVVFSNHMLDLFHTRLNILKREYRNTLHKSAFSLFLFNCYPSLGDCDNDLEKLDCKVISGSISVDYLYTI